MKLEEFISRYDHDTDCYVTHWESDGEEFVTCTLDAYPWWIDEKEREGKRGVIRITLHKIIESELALGARARAVEELIVDENDPLLWSRGEHAQFYSSAPLPRPEELFIRVGDISRNHGINRDPLFYFGGTPFRDWKSRVVDNNSYMIVTVPLPIGNDVEAALNSVGAEYSRVDTGSDDSIKGLQVVWIGESWFICEDAEVELSSSSNKRIQIDARISRD